MTATSCRRRSGKGTKGHGGDTREVGGPKGERMRARGGVARVSYFVELLVTSGSNSYGFSCGFVSLGLGGWL